jgi:hypothetical protein
LSREVYNYLLDETKDVARQSVSRLRKLNARFPAAVPEDCLESLQRSLAADPSGEAGPRAERRSAPRFARKRTRLTIVGVGGGSEGYEGRLMERSWQGMQILCPRQVEVGRVLAVYSADPEGDLSLCLVEVARCERREDGWAVGCQLLRS